MPNHDLATWQSEREDAAHENAAEGMWASTLTTGPLRIATGTPDLLVVHNPTLQEVVRIDSNGTVRVADGVHVDDAARAFWKALEVHGCTETARLRTRVDELLRANNAEVERRRAAEREVRHLKDEMEFARTNRDCLRDEIDQLAEQLKSARATIAMCRIVDRERAD